MTVSTLSTAIALLQGKVPPPSFSWDNWSLRPL
jgi:hypothetical protein